MDDASVIKLLIGILILLIGYFGAMISRKLEKVQTDLNGIAINHGQRLTKLETRAEIIKGQIMHGQNA